MEDSEADIGMDGDDLQMVDGIPKGLAHLMALDAMPYPGQTPNGVSPSESTEDDEVDDGLGYPEEHARRNLLGTGCCYDDRMKLHANADFGPSAHHPEDPSRIEEIMKTFKRAKLVYDGPVAELREMLKVSPQKFMWRIQSRKATREEICIAHTPQHFEWVESLSTQSTAELRRITKVMDQGRQSLYVGSMTFMAALIAAGGAIETCKAVVESKVKNAIAIIRPPGHHAEYNLPMGFCLFNNVPIAAKICQIDYPELCRKVLIVDWDVHHGNGIQNIFYADPNVLYISIHVYQNGEFYPGKPDNPMTPDGGIEHCGTGLGLGKNINIGWASQGMGDGEYMAAFQNIIMPIAQEFDPDLVIISAGFDAADGDELGGCFVTPACYAHMTHMLMSLANGKIAVCLEGGYNLQAISQSALAVARTLTGEPPPKMTIPSINKDAFRLLHQVKAYQAPYWESMRRGIVDAKELHAQQNDIGHLLQTDSAHRLHDVIRAAQRLDLSEKHGMVPLFMQHDTLFRSFASQVLVTQKIHEARRILFIIHDPPAIFAQPDPWDGTVEAHNTFLNDGVRQYIDWAISKNFGVIDVNVPLHVTHPEEMDSFTPRPEDGSQQQQIHDLMCYLWDNYLQLYEAAEEIFLMGVGNANLGIKLLLINRDCKSRVSGVINFVDGALRPVKSDVDESLSIWYKENSRIYVANDHACWRDPDLTRKVNRRRFGTVFRSPVTGISRMLHAHASDVEKWILSRQLAGHGETTEEDQDNGS